jgi:two-component system sensor histidine kinase BarA
MKNLDIQQSIAAANNNVSLAKELFTMLLDDLALRFEQIETSYQSKELSNLAEHIHKLYGATAYCIVPKLRACTQQLDKALGERNYTELEKLVTAVLHEIKQLIDSGPAFLQQDWSVEG